MSRTNGVYTRIHITPVRIHITPVRIHITPVRIHITPVRLHHSQEEGKWRIITTTYYTINMKVNYVQEEGKQYKPRFPDHSSLSSSILLNLTL